ncbi:MAG: class I SAM-dependent rRNA methyltransferase [Nitrospirae bacterium]|nr:class I SAM-dependent rRNA methyltransferase [Nitrospirota bacterium]
MVLDKAHLKRSRRILNGHLWIFSNEIAENLKNFVPGSQVQVYDHRGTFLGQGYINPSSLISVRLLSRDRDPVDREFFKKRILSAVRLRSDLIGDRDACRIIFSEGDYLPGLIVDKYGSCVVIQFLTAGMDALRETIVGLIDEVLRPETIVLRNDSRSRLLEGLPLYKETVKGTLDVLPVIRDDGMIFEVDPLEGQKTGFFLDQVENRKAFKNIAGPGRGLDLFCYTGAWSLSLASGGARVTGIDVSERAVDQATKNAERNALQDRAQFIKYDVFDYLKKEVHSGKADYDFIVCDPPAFVKSASKVREAVRAYTDLNAACMRLIRPGGLLSSSSCSYHMKKEMFLEMLLSAAKDAGRSLRLVAMRSQAMDHPVLLAMPETEYLKCAFLVVD